MGLHGPARVKKYSRPDQETLSTVFYTVYAHGYAWPTTGRCGRTRATRLAARTAPLRRATSSVTSARTATSCASCSTSPLRGHTRATRMAARTGPLRRAPSRVTSAGCTASSRYIAAAVFYDGALVIGERAGRLTYSLASTGRPCAGLRAGYNPLQTDNTQLHCPWGTPSLI